MNIAIQAAASRDYELKCRIGENDLIASKAHYHKACKLKSDRGIADQPTTSSSGHPLQPYKSAFNDLVKILEDGFRHGNVYQMDNILAKYHELLRSAGIEDPTYRSYTLKERLAQHFGPRVCFCRQRQMNQPLLVFSTISSGQVVEALKVADEMLLDTKMTGNATLEPKDSF